MSKGYVYILSNESMPGLVKIGRTNRDPAGRARELYQTGVPTEFKVEHQVYAPDCHELERAVHAHFEEFRVNGSREFFALRPQDAALDLDNLHRERVEVLLDEFLPDHTPIESTFTIDEGHILWLADRLDVHPAEITAAIDFINPEELAPALSRWSDRVRSLKSTPEGSK